MFLFFMALMTATSHPTEAARRVFSGCAVTGGSAWRPRAYVNDSLWRSLADVNGWISSICKKSRISLENLACHLDKQGMD